MSRDGWKRWTKTGPKSFANSFRTLWWSSPGPKALEGFKLLKSFVTPSFETTMSSIRGADLLRNGTSLCSFLLNTPVNWPLNSSAYSISESVISVLHLLSVRSGIPWLSFFWLLMYRGFALTSPTELFTYKSCCFLISSLIFSSPEPKAHKVSLYYSKAPSSVVVRRRRRRRRRRPLFVVHTFKPLYTQGQLANFSQILSVASLGWGKGCLRFWDRSNQNCDYHGNRKPPLT